VDVLDLHRIPRPIASAVTRRTIALIVLVLVLPACGSSGKETSTAAESPASWANSFCGSLATWKSSLTSAGKSLQNTSTLSKAKLQDAANAVSKANDTLVSDLKALGKPPTQGADKAQSAVQSLSTQLEQGATQIKDAAKNVSGANGAVKAVTSVTNTLLQMGSEIAATFTTLQSVNSTDAWKSAFADSQACQSLKKS
jgi:hypothetical protein